MASLDHSRTASNDYRSVRMRSRIIEMSMHGLHDVRVRRERTALRRTGLSRPIRVALEDGIINPQKLVFDYGCGHGDDLRYLSSLGISCSGWDPAFAPA